MGNFCGTKKSDSEIERKELRSIFKEFDENHDGYLSQAELTRALKRLGLEPTSLEVNTMFTAADKNRDGKISFEEFQFLMKQSPALRSLQHTFRQFDLDGDGYIREDELRQVVSKLGQEVSDAELSAMFKAADLDGDMRISFEEFAQMMKRHPLVLSLREVFRQFDVDSDGYISESELRVVCRQLSIGVSDQEVTEMFCAADKNGDGRISFEEFSALLTQQNR